MPQGLWRQETAADVLLSRSGKLLPIRRTQRLTGRRIAPYRARASERGWLWRGHVANERRDRRELVSREEWVNR